MVNQARNKWKRGLSSGVGLVSQRPWVHDESRARVLVMKDLSCIGSLMML